MKFFDSLKDVWLSIALPAVHAESSDPKNSSSKTSHHPSSKQGHDSQSADPKHGSHHHTREYRECGETHSVPLDKHLPDINLEDLEPMKSIVPECQNLKLEYDDCFNHWFAHNFLNGSTNMKPCMELFKKYTSCVKQGLQDQNIELYPHLSLIPPDPEIHKIDKPRTKPPPGAKLHKESDHHRDPHQHGPRN